MVTTDAVLYRGRTSTEWPGDAQVKYIVPWIHKGAWRGNHVIDDKIVSGISSRLEEQAEEVGDPFLLAVNRGLAGTGAKIYGQGFLLSAKEVESLIASSPHCGDVIQPYVNGAELYSLVGDHTERYVINFRDWPLARGGNGPAASDFPECLKIVTERVKPDREAITGEYGSAKYRREVWWRFSNDAEAIYRKLRNHKTMLVRARISNTHAIKFVPVTWVCNEKTVLFAVRSFCVLQSSIHEAWVERYASTLRGFLQYTTAGCFETFPFPLKDIDTAIGQAYDIHRSSAILERKEGLTRIYNRFHNCKEHSMDLHQLRTYHIQMDQAVAAAYDWSDLDLGHGFHETKQGTRFTISESARRKVLARLLKLNHERYAVEVAQGLHDKGKGKPKATGRKGKKASSKDEPMLF
jgi:hypothetical protein